MDVYDALHGVDESAECALCGRPATDGPLCGDCFSESWTFDSDAEADAHARAMDPTQRLAALTLRGECIRCGERIEEGLARLGSTECVNCKRPQTTAA